MMMIDDQSRELLSLAFQFYGRAFSFPYDELTHELQRLFRDMEKAVQDDAGNTLAARALEIINHYQGEELSALQAEYARLFSGAAPDEATVSQQMSDYFSEQRIAELQNQLWDEDSMFTQEEFQESVLFLLDYFCSVLQNEEPEGIERFFENYLRPAIPALCDRVYQAATLGFYREAARGLGELIFLCAE
jgi:TorA maturation chaperone TorD